MNRFNRTLTRLAGALLIVGPGLVVCAALLAAAGIGTTTGRWYDNRLEGILMATGFSLQLVGLVELCRRIGASHPAPGKLLFIRGQSSFEVYMPAYIAGVSAWQLGLAAAGWELLGEENSPERVLAEAVSAS